MKNLLTATLGSLAILVCLTGTTWATTFTFVGGVTNADLPQFYGSNIAGPSTAEFVTNDGTGATPDIALTWAPAGGIPNVSDPNADVWEFHNSGTFTNPAGPAFTAPVLQLDVDASNHTEPPADPTIDFTVTGGFAFKLNTFQIGNATDQFEAPYRWVISLIRLSDMVTVNTQTTGFMSAGNKETVTFNYTGDPDEDYRLLFDDEGADAVRTAIDNFSFSQVSAGVNGDYNNNGKVDAADYVLWRNGDSPDSSQAGYNLWKANFGNPPGSGSGLGSSAVPEPSTLRLMGVLLIGLATGSRRAGRGR
jgi:hypothetical protein